MDSGKQMTSLTGQKQSKSRVTACTLLAAAAVLIFFWRVFIYSESGPDSVFAVKKVRSEAIALVEFEFNYIYRLLLCSVAIRTLLALYISLKSVQLHL